MFDSVLFDLDGTLWDATPTMERVWADVLSRHPEIHRPPVTRTEIKGNMGLLVADIRMRMFPELTQEAQRAIMQEFNAEDARRLSAYGGHLFPGTEETLERLSKLYRLFIVSNCQDGYIECFYTGNGLSRFFSGSECAGRTGKPKSETIQLVVKRYGLQNPIYIGDTMLDCTSARDAGIPFLHAAYGFGQVPEAASVQAFSDIPAALENMSPP